jgi:hypothetical protein
VKLTSETHSVNRRLHCLDEMRCILFLCASAFSLLKETLSFNLRLLYIDERLGPGALRLGLETGFHTTHYTMGIFVMGFLNEACYSLISVCNEL